VTPSLRHLRLLKLRGVLCCRLDQSGHSHLRIFESVVECSSQYRGLLSAILNALDAGSNARVMSNRKHLFRSLPAGLTPESLYTGLGKELRKGRKYLFPDL